MKLIWSSWDVFKAKILRNTISLGKIHTHSSIIRTINIFFSTNFLSIETFFAQNFTSQIFSITKTRNLSENQLSSFPALNSSHLLLYSSLEFPPSCWAFRLDAVLVAPSTGRRAQNKELSRYIIILSTELSVMLIRYSCDRALQK